MPFPIIESLLNMFTVVIRIRWAFPKMAILVAETAGRNNVFFAIITSIAARDKMLRSALKS